MVFSHLLGREVDSASEEHRHECECRWLLANKPTRSEKHLYLYGVADRAKIIAYDKLRNPVLREGASSFWQKDERGRTIKPIVAWRGLEAADRILADAKRLYEMNEQAA